jgi:uncharacterized membrane protein
MSDLAIFAAVTCVAVLMLIVSFRSLTWHRVSQPLNTLLLLLTVIAAWQLVARVGPISFEQGLLFTLSVLLGLVVGFARAQAIPLRYEPREGGVICRRGALLIFCWAAVAVADVTSLAGHGLYDPAWQTGLPAALLFLTASFISSTLTLFYRISTREREEQAQSAEQPQAQ